MIQKWETIEQVLKWLGQPEVQTIALAVIALFAIIVIGIIWLLYYVLKYTHHAIELVFHSFSHLINVIKDELAGRINHPAIKVERIILILNFVGVLASLLLLMIGEHFHIHSYYAFIAVTTFLVIFSITCLLSGSYASHFS
jgi:hypothetical protein